MRLPGRPSRLACSRLRDSGERNLMRSGRGKNRERAEEPHNLELGAWNRLGKALTIENSKSVTTLEFNSLRESTVEPRFNEPLYNEVLGITNNIRQPGQSYSKMYGTEPRYNEILVITSTIQKPKRKMYLDITNKCQHATEKMNAKQTNTRMKRLSNFSSSFLLLKFCWPIQFSSAVAMYRSVQCTIASYRP